MLATEGFHKIPCKDDVADDDGEALNEERSTLAFATKPVVGACLVNATSGVRIFIFFEIIITFLMNILLFVVIFCLKNLILFLGVLWPSFGHHRLSREKPVDRSVSEL